MNKRGARAAALSRPRPEVVAALLRGGAGKHSDRRTKRERTRGDVMRAELRREHV